MVLVIITIIGHRRFLIFYNWPFGQTPQWFCLYYTMLRPTYLYVDHLWIIISLFTFTLFILETNKPHKSEEKYEFFGKIGSFAFLSQYLINIFKKNFLRRWRVNKRKLVKIVLRIWFLFKHLHLAVIDHLVGDQIEMFALRINLNNIFGGQLLKKIQNNSSMGAMEKNILLNFSPNANQIFGFLFIIVRWQTPIKTKLIFSLIGCCVGWFFPMFLALFYIKKSYIPKNNHKNQTELNNWITIWKSKQAAFWTPKTSVQIMSGRVRALVQLSD